MDDLKFLTDSPSGGATLLVQPIDVPEKIICRLNFNLIEEACPTLADRFHDMGDGFSAYTMKDTTATAAICLLRYIYLGDYMICEAAVDTPIPPLLHLQVFRLAEIWSLPDLQQLVQTYLSMETDPTYGIGYHPVDLCDGLRYLYVELLNHVGIRKILADYCVANFVNDGLKSSEIFRQTVFECSALLQDLCRANMDNGFSDPSALEIMQLPVCQHPIHDDKSIDPASLNFVCGFHTEEQPVTPEQHCSNEGNVESDGSRSTDSDLISMSDPISPRVSETSTDSHGFTIIAFGDFDWAMLDPETSKVQDVTETWSDSEFELIIR